MCDSLIYVHARSAEANRTIAITLDSEYGGVQLGYATNALMHTTTRERERERERESQQHSQQYTHMPGRRSNYAVSRWTGCHGGLFHNCSELT